MGKAKGLTFITSAKKTEQGVEQLQGKASQDLKLQHLGKTCGNPLASTSTNARTANQENSFGSKRFHLPEDHHVLQIPP